MGVEMGGQRGVRGRVPYPKYEYRAAFGQEPARVQATRPGAFIR